MDLFQSNRSATARIREIKTWVVEVFGLDEGTTVMVTELRCTEPGCPPLETVIALLNQSTRQFKIHKSADEVTRSDIERIVTEAGSHGCA